MRWGEVMGVKKKHGVLSIILIKTQQLKKWDTYGRLILK